MSYQFCTPSIEQHLDFISQKGKYSFFSIKIVKMPIAISQHQLHSSINLFVKVSFLHLDRYRSVNNYTIMHKWRKRNSNQNSFSLCRNRRQRPIFLRRPRRSAKIGTVERLRRWVRTRTVNVSRLIFGHTFFRCIDWVCRFVPVKLDGELFFFGGSGMLTDWSV